MGAKRNNCGIPGNNVFEKGCFNLDFFPCFIKCLLVLGKSFFLIQPHQLISNWPVFNSGNGFYYYTYSPMVLSDTLLHPISILKWRLIHINSVLFLKKFVIPKPAIFVEFINCNVW